ncbi:hypothetical protein H4S07_003681 [Coemansia furcata]|uniref:Uncharacterized protein n=1 Tax=Coemansia furcata TaxID=417177 RepID=A0ACC1LFA9_9FUNG|nr:hypothetical protein H4S07_003681 [Coemansia furcata]KAJ2821923.1 hypothetical protein GGI24_004081 [Coemansia furcata]
MFVRTVSSRLRMLCAANAMVSRRSGCISRGIATSLILRTEAASEDASTAQAPKSIATHGTQLKGLNIYKEGKDPVALKDEEYPEWLWTLLDKVPEAEKSEREQQRLQRSRAIKEANFMKSKKK